MWWVVSATGRHHPSDTRGRATRAPSSPPDPPTCPGDGAVSRRDVPLQAHFAPSPSLPGTGETGFDLAPRTGENDCRWRRHMGTGKGEWRQEVPDRIAIVPTIEHAACTQGGFVDLVSADQVGNPRLARRP